MIYFSNLGYYLYCRFGIARTRNIYIVFLLIKALEFCLLLLLLL